MSSSKIVAAVFSTSHTAITIRYFVFAILAGLLLGYLSYLYRIELMHPGMQEFKSPHIYSALISLHGDLIRYLFLIPTLIGGFGNWVVVPILGVKTTAFPRLNNLFSWFLPVAFFVLLLVICLPSSPAITSEISWVAHPPSKEVIGNPMAYYYLMTSAVGIAILASVFCAINILATVVKKQR